MKQVLTRAYASIRRMIEQVRAVTFSAEIAALIGVIVYLIAAFRDAHSKLSFLDEGLYLFKGWLFATGQYMPFEDFGVWTNHMPLAFLIPGQIQEWFGAGLRTGRYFSIFLAVLLLIGLWSTVKGLAGKWWAAAALWAIAINPAGIKLYTIAISQAIVACVFIWMLYFSLGKDKRIWQLAIAGILSGAMILIRENMVPVFPILVLSIWWRYGWRSGVASFLGGAAVLAAGHAIFWPGILQIWSTWLPVKLTPFLDPWRLLTSGISAQSLIPDRVGFFAERSTNLWLVVRMHFAGVMGALASILLFPKKQDWRSTWERQAAIFLSILFFVLFAFHLYATFGMDYCVSCILLYTSFFDFVGIILFILTIRSVKWGYPGWRNSLNWFVIITFTVEIIYSSLEDILRPIFTGGSEGLVQFGHRIMPDMIPAVQELLGLRYYPAVRIVLFSILIVAILVIIFLLVVLGRKVKFSRILAISSKAMMIFVIIGLVLSPTIILGAGNDFFNCGGDVIKSYEDAGRSLMKAIPPGSTVYWEGRSDAIFLYLPGIKIFPPQLNHVHGFYNGGDPTELLRLGRYNTDLSIQWFVQADYILIEQEWGKKWQFDDLTSPDFIKVGPTYTLGLCESAGKLQLYRRSLP